MTQRHTSQNYLVLTLEAKKYTLEFIRHSDHNIYIYINGGITDVSISRHIKLHKGMDNYNIFENLKYGCSRYNEKIISSVFNELIPEHFL